MIKAFNNLEEIQKYYDEKTNTYVFKEDDKYIDLVLFNFDLKINSNISASNINARNITYYAVCFAHHNIRCRSIKGRRTNHKHYVLDGVIDVEDEI